MARQYYSVRTQKNPLARGFDLAAAKRLFLADFVDLRERSYFAGSFGYNCVDLGHLPGTLGSDPGAAMLRHLRKGDLWPIDEHVSAYAEDDLFDVIEWLYDNVSVPEEDPNEYHSFGGCGFHYSRFDWDAGRAAFRDATNSWLRDYSTGYELTAEGEVRALADPGFEPLLEAPLPGAPRDSVEDRVARAVKKFRSRSSSWDDRRDAVRDLVDVLEYLRPQVKELLTKKDEGDLFNLANNFGIRHHNESQKTDYDPNVWVNWMFYFYLSTIHAFIRLQRRKERVE